MKLRPMSAYVVLALLFAFRLSSAQPAQTQQDFGALVEVVNRVYLQPQGLTFDRLAASAPGSAAMVLGHALQRQAAAAASDPLLFDRCLELERYALTRLCAAGESSEAEPEEMREGLRRALADAILGKADKAVQEKYSVAPRDVPVLAAFLKGADAAPPAPDAPGVAPQDVVQFDFPVPAMNDSGGLPSFDEAMRAREQLGPNSLFSPAYKPVAPGAAAGTPAATATAAAATATATGPRRIAPEARRWVRATAQTGAAGSGLAGSNEIELLQVRPSDVYKDWDFIPGAVNSDVIVGTYDVEFKTEKTVAGRSGRQPLESVKGQVRIESAGAGVYRFVPLRQFVLQLPEGQQKNLEPFTFANGVAEGKKLSTEYYVRYGNASKADYTDTYRLGSTARQGRSPMSEPLALAFSVSKGFDRQGDGIAVTLILLGDFADFVVHGEPSRIDRFHVSVMGRQLIHVFEGGANR